MNLIAELRRRNVIRVAGLYLVGAWLVTQVAGTVLPMFGAPEWLPRSIVILLAICFVPALILSWIYELTPEGIRRDVDVPSEQSIGKETARRIDRAIIVVLLVALGYFAIDKFVLAPKRVDQTALQQHATAASTTTDRSVAQESAIDPDSRGSDSGAIATDASIAVLPFVNMSSDKEQEYFSDGLAEELLNQLAQIPQLRVIARTSSFSFKGKEVDVATIARALHVANVLEGSVRKSGNSLRITAQLIRTVDSSHVWSKTYDREINDVFKVQDEIAGEVVATLKVTLLPDRKRTSSGRSGNIEAYNHYLRGRELAALADRESWRAAIGEFQQAIDLDPSYTSAYANQAASLVFLSDLMADPLGQEKAQQGIEKALALSPGDPEALSVRGWMRSVFLWNWDGARADFEASLASSPNDASTLARYSWLLAALGRLPEAIETARKAYALDPLSDHAAVNLSVFLNASGRQAESIDIMQRRLEVNSKDDFANIVLGQALLLDGKPAEALDAARKAGTGVRLTISAMGEHSLGHSRESAQALDDLQRNHASGYAFQIAEVHIWRGENDAAFEWFERAYSQRDGGLAMLKYSPLLGPVRSDPRYSALVRRVRLPE